LVVKAAALYFFLAPFLYLGAFGLFKHGKPWPTGEDLAALTFTSQLVLGGSWVAAIAAWQVRKWSLYVVIAYCMCTVFHNAYALLNGHQVVFPEWLVFGAQVIGLVGVVVFLHREIRAPYLNPRICWWRTSPRYRVAFEVELTTLDGGHTVELLDISASGCFVTPYASPELGQPVRVRINQLGCAIETKGELVRLGVAGRPGGGTVEGAGVKFDKLDRSTKATLQKLLRALAGVSGDRKAPITLQEVEPDVRT